MKYEKLKKPPSAIYLQLYRDCQTDEPDFANATWCQNKIFPDDVRYVMDKRYKRKLKKK